MGFKTRHSSSFVRLLFNKDSSHKFWEIEIRGDSHTVLFGRIGSVGQRKTKKFPSPEAAMRDARALVLSKKRKGYSQRVSLTPSDYLAFMEERHLECHIHYEWRIEYYPSTVFWEGSLSIGAQSQCIIVDGDLYADELYIEDSAGLFVFGDLHVAKLITDEGEVRVFGTLTATEMLRLGESGIFHADSLATPLLEDLALLGERHVIEPRADYLYSARLTTNR